MNLLPPRFINYLYITVCWLILLPSCSSDENINLNDKFRGKYDGTFWQWDGGIIKFSTDKLLYVGEGNSICDEENTDCCDENIKCYFYEEGSNDNVSFDGYIFEKFTYVLVEENSDKLVFSEIRSSGKPTDPNLTMTPGIEITTTFEELGENIISMKFESSFGEVTYSLVKSNNSFSSNSCLNGLLSGRTIF